MTAHNEPPPSYDCVMALDEVISRKRKNLYTFKAYHPGLVIKDCMRGDVFPTTPQVSLDENNCDIRSPSSAVSLCNCNCVINQNYASNLCANCNSVIDVENNNVTCTVTTISGGNLAQDNCPLSDANRPPSPATEFDLLNDQLNNNDFNGNIDSIASPSTSTDYASCSVPLSCGQQKSADEDDDEDEINGNGNCRQQCESVNLSTINCNGLIRLDMSQIIDQTGLPTYEAALQLKSSGYV